MSQAQRSPTPSPSSQPSSQTSSTADQPRPVELRYAETEVDAVEIHRFLVKVAGPVLRCEVDIVKSLMEVLRVVQQEAALMLMDGDELVGTMGIMKVTWWYGAGEFMTDRWHFALPGQPSEALLDEAVEIAHAAGLDFIHQGKIRERKGIYRGRPTLYAVEKED